MLNIDFGDLKLNCIFQLKQIFYSLIEIFGKRSIKEEAASASLAFQCEWHFLIVLNNIHR